MVSDAVIAVAAVVLAVAGAGIGFVAGYEYRGSPAARTAAVENSTLSILGAGTLNGIFPRIAAELVNQTPNVSAPAAAQTYEGSLNVATAIASTGAKADVAAMADFRLIPHLLEPSRAGYEIVFASTPEVLVYDPALVAFDGINASNWGDKLVADVNTPGNAPFAVWNASTDPNGYNAIFSLELQGIRHNTGASAYYATFYSGGSAAPAAPVPGRSLVEKESNAASEIRTGVVSALITYRSYAVANGLHFVPMDPDVGLAANDPPALAEYANLSTTIVGASGGFTKVTAAPVLFAVTVPNNALNPALGAAFVHLLLSPEGSALLSTGGAFTPIFPGWIDRAGAAPPILAPDLIAPPAWAVSDLA